jgi:predicted RNA-binding protein with PUA-like domain
MRHWLFKTEPETFSIADLQRAPDSGEPWDGIRNYQARNFLRDDVKIGDHILIYHSNCAQPGIVGEGLVVREAYPDPTQFLPESRYFDPKSAPEKPRWVCVNVRFQAQWSAPLLLAELRLIPELADMVLLRKGSRLSIQPVTEWEWAIIRSLSQANAGSAS